MPGQDTPNLIAGGTIRTHRAVKISTTEDNTALECNGGEICIGITTGDNLEFDSDNHAVDGGEVRLQSGRIMLWEAGSALSAGDILVSDDEGVCVERGIAQAGKGVAIALQAAVASGDVIEVMFIPHLHT